MVGRFGRPRGISGEIFLVPLTDNPDRLKKDGRFWIEDKGGYTRIKLTSVNKVSRKTTARIEGVTSPEEAKKYTNRNLFIHVDDLGSPKEGSYFNFDLIDCRVIDEQGVEFGVVADIENYPANDVIVIRDAKRQVFRLPMVAEFVLKVDLDKNEITINPPEGIFDSPDEN